MDNEEAEKRRQKLRSLRDEHPETASVEEDIEGAEMLSFVKTIKEQKERRKKQFSIINQLFEDPLTFDLDKQVIPTSSTAEEIAARKKELQYRIDILQAILEVAESEMQLLTQAMQSKVAEPGNKSSPEESAPDKDNGPDTSSNE